MRIRGPLTLGLLTVSTAALLWEPAKASARLLTRSWDARVAVAGRSMEPALEDGDWVLVDPAAYAERRPKRGELVLAPDPREPERVLIKRVASVARDGRLELLGDAPEASTDSRVFGTVDAAEVRGRPWFRYWPIGRVGPLR
ncbi:MAG: nickel-type superoxide dismutase maturation protease [Chloroflexota bacterium]